MLSNHDLSELKRLSTNFYDEEKKFINRVIVEINVMANEINVLKSEINKLKGEK